MSETEADNKHHFSGHDLEQLEKEKAPRRIITFKDLLEEEQRLVMEVKRNKTRVTEDLNLVKAKLQPANQALSFMSKLTGGTGRPGILAHGVDIAVDLLSKKYLFRRSNWFMTLAGSYLVRGLSHLFFSKTKSKKPDPRHNGIERQTAEDMPNQ